MAMSAASIRAGQAFVEILADDSKARRVLKQFQAHTQSWATTMNNLGRAMLLPAVGFGLAMQNTTRVFADFEREMSKVKARLDVADAGFESLRKKAIELGKTTAFSATEAAAAMTKFAEAGYDSARIATIMGPAIDLAAAGLMDLNEAADVIVTTLNAFNLQADQIPHVVDIIAKASVESASDVRELAQSFVYASTVASTAGVPLHDLVGVLSLLHDSGIKADIAGTSVRGMILSLTSPSEKASQAMRQLGVQVEDLQGNMLPLATIVEQFRKATAGMGSAQRLKFIGEIFDTRQASAFAKLVDLGGQRITDRIDLIYDSTGTAAEVARTQMDNLHGDWKRLVGSFESFQITMTDAVVTPLRGFINALRVAIQIADEFAKQNPVLVKWLTALGVSLAIAAPLLIAVSVGMKLVAFASEGLLLTMTALRGSIWLVATGFQLLMSVAVPLIGIIGTGLVAAFRLLATVMLMSVGAALKQVMLLLFQIWLNAHILLARVTVAIVETLVMAAISAVTALIPVVAAAFTAIGTAVSFLIANPIALLALAIIGIGAYIIYASGAWTRALNSMISMVGRLAGDFKKAWGVIVDSVKAGRIDLAFRAVCILMKIAWLELVDFLMSNWEEFADFVVNVWDEAVTNLSIGIARLQAKWEEFFDWLRGQKPPVEGWLPPDEKGERKHGLPAPGEMPDGAGWQAGVGGEPMTVADTGGSQVPFGVGSSPASVAAWLLANSVAAIPTGDEEWDANQKDFGLDPDEVRKSQQEAQERARKRDEKSRDLPPSVKGRFMRERTPEEWAQARRDQRQRRKERGQENPNRSYEDGGLAGVVRRNKEEPPRPPWLREQADRAEAHAELLEKKAAEADKRLEVARGKHEKRPTAQTEAEVNLREREAQNARQRAERQRKKADELRERDEKRKQDREEKKEKGKPPAGEDREPEGENPPSEEKPPELPAALQQANEDLAAAQKRHREAETPEEIIKAERDLRRAERRQRIEQRKFDRRQGIEGQRKQLDEARKEAEQALGGGDKVGRGKAGNFLDDMLSGARASVVGTFSAAGAAGLGAGNSQLTKIAAATESTAKNTKDIKNKKGPAFG